MKVYRYRLATMILVLFFSVLIPVSFIAVGTMAQNALFAEQQVLMTKQQQLAFFVNQCDINLENIESSIQKLLADNTTGYVALRRDMRDERYQRAKFDLHGVLENYEVVFGWVDGFYARIDGDRDVMLLNSSGYGVEDYYLRKELCSQIQNGDGYLKPQILEVGDTAWLICGYRNSYLEVGYLISIDELQKRFFGEESVQEEICILLEGRELDETGPVEAEYYRFEQSFSKLDARLCLITPSGMLTEQLDWRGRMEKMLPVLIVLSLPFTYVLFWIYFVRTLKVLMSAMEEIQNGNTEYRIQNFSRAKEFCEIEHTFNDTLDYNQKLRDEKYELMIQKEQQQFLNLKLQINPHLLLNSLSTIYSLAQNKKVAEIQNFSVNLSKYFRYALRDSEELVRLQSEIDFIKSYVKVQKIRYPDRFYVMFDIEEELMEIQILPLVIENFVENSIKYALKPDEEIEILVIVRREKEKLRIAVCDNGRGIEPAVLEKIQRGEIVEDTRGKHIGIWNCVRRIRAFYGEGMSFAITSMPGEGTQIWLELPVQNGGEVEYESFDCG